jgi:hypothetical protein
MIKIYTHFCQEEILGIPRAIGNDRIYFNNTFFAIFMPSIPLQISTRLKEVSAHAEWRFQSDLEKIPHKRGRMYQCSEYLVEPGPSLGKGGWRIVKSSFPPPSPLLRERGERVKRERILG